MLHRDGRLALGAANSHQLNANPADSSAEGGTLSCQTHQDAPSPITTQARKPRRRRFYDASWECENIEKYRVGGFHPVVIGDVIDRYKIVHKLGYGGFSTVWLARDSIQQVYVALKINIANTPDRMELEHLVYLRDDQRSNHPGRKYILPLIRSFTITGPNGTHLCLVLPVTGPDMYTMVMVRNRLKPEVARAVAWKATQAVAYLHSEGLCHGDITPRNVVFQFRNLNHLSEEEIYAQFGKPKTEELDLLNKDDQLGPEAPKHITKTMKSHRATSEYFTDDIYLLDFGESYHVTEAKTKGAHLGIPLSYKAPEALIAFEAGAPADIWALACTIYAVRTGHALIENFFGNLTTQEILHELGQILGELPHALAYTHFNEQGLPSQSEEKGQIRKVLLGAPPLRECLLQTRDVSDSPPPTRKLRATNFFWERLQGDDKHDRQIRMSEVDVLENLLRSMLDYDPRQRLTAEKICEENRSWFFGEF